MYLCERVDSRERSIDGCAVLKDNTGRPGIVQSFLLICYKFHCF